MNIAIVLSGGIGSRMGLAVPKQYVLVNNKPVILYALEKFAKRNDIHGIVIVVADEWKSFVETYVQKSDYNQKIYYACAGLTRQDSVYSGLKILNKTVSENDVVIIHDAARPLVDDSIITECIRACDEYDGAMPVISVKDTIYQSLDGIEISGLLDRNQLFAGQAPESFKYGKYLEIHENATPKEISETKGSTEIAYRNKLNIKLIKGSESNFKITTPEDLKNFELIAGSL